jgi:hypothetical protein
MASGSEPYNTIDGYHTSTAAVIFNMAYIAVHSGKARHVPGADLFSVTLNYHDLKGELYFLSITRDRITLSSYKTTGFAPGSRRGRMVCRVWRKRWGVRRQNAWTIVEHIVIHTF